jgi:hypothetical protein
VASGAQQEPGAVSVAGLLPKVGAFSAGTSGEGRVADTDIAGDAVLRSRQCPATAASGAAEGAAGLGEEAGEETGASGGGSAGEG